jgi:predicted metal-dependent hydrolase
LKVVCDDIKTGTGAVRPEFHLAKGYNMQYELIRSKRKTVSLEVRRDGSVIVRAPLRMSKKEIEKFVSSHEKWLENAVRRQSERRSREVERTPEEIKKAKQELKTVLLPLIDKYSALMGVKPEGVTITSAKTRFGSCSGKNRLSFTYRLVDCPGEAVEYVVVHELAHIKHKNHGRDFYALIESVLPDYREREKMLR